MSTYPAFTVTESAHSSKKSPRTVFLKDSSKPSTSNDKKPPTVHSASSQMPTLVPKLVQNNAIRRLRYAQSIFEVLLAHTLAIDTQGSLLVYTKVPYQSLPMLLYAIFSLHGLQMWIKESTCLRTQGKSGCVDVNIIEETNEASMREMGDWITCEKLGAGIWISFAAACMLRPTVLDLLGPARPVAKPHVRVILCSVLLAAISVVQIFMVSRHRRKAIQETPGDGGSEA